MKLNLKIVAATAAVAMMSSGVANAATGSIAVSPAGTYTYSKEGLALSGTTGVALPDLVVTFGNNLTYQDDILITLPGATSLAPTSLAGLVTCTGAANAVGYVTTVTGGWNFRVTDVGGITIGTQCTFTGLKVTAASLATTGGKVFYQANRGLTSPTVIVDGVADTGVAIAVKTQFAVTTQQKLNGIIDVYADRKQFADDETVAPGDAAADPALADTLNFSTFTSGSPVVGTWTGPTAVPTNTTVTITGDFSWVDGSDTNTTCDVAEFGTALVGYAADWSVDAASNCSQVVLTDPTADTTNLGYFLVPGTKVLSATDWTGTAKFDYNLSTAPTTKSSTTLSWDPGAWTLNGAQVYIQYMPYGSGISRIIYAANDGVQNADVTADVTANGETFQCALGNAPAKTVTSLSSAIDTCVAARAS